MKHERNPVKKNMDKFHKPSTHTDKSKYDRKSESEIMQDELEPIWHSTEFDESDDIEQAANLIIASKRPVVYIGGGLINSGITASNE